MSSPTYNENYDPATKQAGGVQTKLPIKLGASTSSCWITQGTGAPAGTAPQGSLYLRTDGSSTSTRLYVASATPGTWIAVTTAS